MLLTVILIVGMLQLLHLTWALLQTLVASALGLKPREVSVGLGPVVVTQTLGRTRYIFRLLPVLAAVRFENGADGTPDGSLDNEPLWRHAVLGLTPWLAIVALGLTQLGPTPGLHHFATGFLILLEPHRLGSRLERLVDLVRTSQLRTALALLLVKAAAVNLTPVAPLSGGMLVARALRGWSVRLAEGWRSVGVAAYLLWLVVTAGYWAWQLVAGRG